MSEPIYKRKYQFEYKWDGLPLSPIEVTYTSEHGKYKYTDSTSWIWFESDAGIAPCGTTRVFREGGEYGNGMVTAGCFSPPNPTVNLRNIGRFIGAQVFSVEPERFFSPKINEAIDWIIERHEAWLTEQFEALLKT